MTIEENVIKIKEAVFVEKKIVKELNSMFSYLKNSDDEKERQMINGQIGRLKKHLKKTNDNLLTWLDEMGVKKPLEAYAATEITTKPQAKPQAKKAKYSRKPIEKIPELDKEVLKRLMKKGKKVAVKKEKKPSRYVKMANSFFAGKVKSLIKQKKFASLEKDMIKSNLGYTPITYISILIFSVIVAFLSSIVIFLFFLFFNLSATMPFISPMTEPLGTRLIETFWILIAVPFSIFLFMYFYPSLEKKSLEGKINQELPFATIHMAAISGSMIEPTKVFSIISATKEYPNLEKEFNKLLNEINVYGYDLVTALKDVALNSPSRKLGELFNGLATTITSGGDLFDFFDKRSQTLLFDYRLDREKETKSAETFMDIYISVVIAAPMILMLLFMMMQISGLGVGMSTSTITFLVVGGVSLINVFFLGFLQLKHQGRT